MEVLPATDLFWLALPSGNRAICVAHRELDDNVKHLWSNALNLGQLEPLLDLEFRDQEEHHHSDEELQQALSSKGSDHSGKHFKRTSINGIFAVGIAGNKKNRTRAVKVAAAIALVISDHSWLQQCSDIWKSFSDLVKQVESVSPNINAVLPHACIFWLQSPSIGKRVLCLKHEPQVSDVWSNARNISGSCPQLRSLEYREKEKGNTEDEMLLTSLGKLPDIDQRQIHFMKTLINNIIVLGIAGRKENRGRAVRVAAAVAFCIGSPEHIEDIKTIWDQFPLLVRQAEACQSRKIVHLTPRRVTSDTLDSHNPFQVGYLAIGSPKPLPIVKDMPFEDQVLHSRQCDTSDIARNDLEISEEPSPITPAKSPRLERADSEDIEGDLIDENAKLLRIVFQERVFDDEEDIEELKGALRLSLRNFKPSGCNAVKLEHDDNLLPAQEPVEDNVFEDSWTDTLKVRELRFTHDSVAPKFRDGSSFQKLLDDLRSGIIDPERNLPPLKVYFWEGCGYYSRDNRRLKCLKEYQREEKWRDILVRAHVFKLPVKIMSQIAGSAKVRRMLSDFLPALTTVNNGESVEVRKRRRKR